MRVFEGRTAVTIGGGTGVSAAVALALAKAGASIQLIGRRLDTLRARRGQAVYINSSSSIIAKPISAQYDSTKHALEATADSLRGEVNAHGV